MAREMREDAGLQLAFDGSGSALEVTAQHPGHNPNATRNRVGNIPELAARPDVAYAHSEYPKPDADHDGAYAGVITPAVSGRVTPRLWCMAAAVVLPLLVIIAVLGGVLGSRSHSAPPASPVLTASSPTASLINNNTDLTAVAWIGTDHVLQYRVYHQSVGNEIRESAWNGTQQSWYTLNDRIGLAKNGSPLVAAVRTDNGGMTINIFFLQNSGQLNELYTTDGASWHDGTLNTQQPIFPKSSSKLAATWVDNYPGNDLRSLLLVYQDDDNHFRLYNSTDDRWVLSTIPGHPIAASGVSLSVMFVGNYPDQLRLYYQIASGNLVVADWLSPTQFDVVYKTNATQVLGRSSGWNLNEDAPLGQFGMEAPITSFPNGRGPSNGTLIYGNVTQLPDLLDILMSGTGGVTAVELIRGLGAYQTAHKPPQMNAVQNYSTLASHAWGSLYALQDGAIVEFAVQHGDFRQWNALRQTVTP